MKLTLTRNPSAHNCTIGDLAVDGEHQCFTLEDEVREVEGKPVTEWKIAGQTAIPRGRYEVIINHSARFKRDLPLLLNVPGFVGVRIHPGNTAEDTEGCILVGEKVLGSAIGESRKAFAELMLLMQDAIAAGEKVHIEIQ